jgi:hypothetical protein
MAPRRWLNPSLPPTLQGAMLFSYLNAAFSLFFMLVGGASLIGLILLVGGFGAYGIANEKRWGYQVCLVVAIVYLVLQLFFFLLFPVLFSELLTLLFTGILVALLLHPLSRSYQRIYFH